MALVLSAAYMFLPTVIWIIFSFYLKTFLCIWKIWPGSNVWKEASKFKWWRKWKIISLDVKLETLAWFKINWNLGKFLKLYGFLVLWWESSLKYSEASLFQRVCLCELYFSFHSLKNLSSTALSHLIDNGLMVLSERYFHLCVYILKVILLYLGTNFLSSTIEINMQMGLV